MRGIKFEPDGFASGFSSVVISDFSSVVISSFSSGVGSMISSKALS
jgi:hypothetical protein